MIESNAVNIILRWSRFCFFNMMLNYNVCAQSFDLKDYVWRKRVLLVFASDAENDRLKQQLSAVKSAKTGFEDRDLVVVCVFKASGFDENNKHFNVEKAEALRKKYGVAANVFKVILIGKDGGAKQTATRPFDNQQLFKVIDAMPMRRDEAKSKSKYKN